MQVYRLTEQMNQYNLTVNSFISKYTENETTTQIIQIVPY